MLKLRPYQLDAVQKAHDALETRHAMLGVAATGGGKTVIFCSWLLGADGVPGALKEGQRALILVHRDELVEQTLETVKRFWPEWDEQLGVVKAERNDVNARLIVGSVPTLQYPERLQELLAAGPIDLLVTDEAHHSVAQIYTQIFDALEDANPDLRHLGVTATPLRDDKRGLRAVYEDVAFTYGIRELVRLGMLAPPTWIGIETDVTIGKAKGGDFNASQMEPLINTPEMRDLIVRSYLKHAKGRKTIIFTPRIKSAQSLAEAFNAAGVSAQFVSGACEDRKEKIERFRAGEWDVLCNAQLLTEGFDDPSVSCIIMARWTNSDVFYIQSTGRALRLFPGKKDAIILDFIPKDERNVLLLGDLLGIPREAIERRDGERSIALRETGVVDLNGVSLEAYVRDLDYLHLRRGWFEWTDVRRALLGTDTDAKIAARLGTKKHVVKFARERWGVEAFDPMAAFWTDERKALLGTDMDAKIAARLGVKVHVVKFARKRFGVETFTPQPEVFEWTDEHKALLGTDTDAKIAARLGTTAAVVAHARKRFEVEAFDPMAAFWTDEHKALLGTDTDAKIAARLGTTAAVVGAARKRFEVEAFDPMAAFWTDERKALLGTDTDENIAARLGVKEGGVKNARKRFEVEAFDPMAAFWTDERRALLGTDSDPNIAARLGVKAGVVRRARERFEVEAFDSGRRSR